MTSQQKAGMRVEEGNKLIELFYSGRKLSDDGTFFGRKQGAPKRYENWYDIVAVSDLKYHSSWDWLMPVVEKINNIFAASTPHIWQGELNAKIDKVIMLPVSTPIKQVWQAVVQFIQWYNTQTSNQ